VNEEQARNERAAISLEDRQARAASTDLRAQLAAATTIIVTARAAGKTGAALLEIVDRVLAVVTPAIGAQLVHALGLAWKLGRRQVIGHTRGDVRPQPDGTLADVVMNADARARRRLDRAREIAHQLPMDDPRDVAAVLAAARRAVTGAETDAGWVVHRGLTLSKHVAAEERGLSLVWVAERNACLNCLAYSGRVIAPRGLFPAGLTYGDHPLKPHGPLVGPPLHPNCRCQLDTTTLRPGDLDVGLAREAARSVARGLTDHASTPARFRAVDRLVSRTPGIPDGAALLPRSVLDRAERNLRNQRFRFRPDSASARAVIRERTRERVRRTARAGGPR
jgi:hypothetical protein